MSITVDPPTLRAVAGMLTTAGGAISGTAGTVSGLDGALAPELASGLAAFGVAWGAALEVMAEDVTFLAGETAAAAERYDRADNALQPQGGRARAA